MNAHQHRKSPMKETTIQLGEGVTINGEFVDCEPFITVEKTNTLVRVNMTIYVDESNFTVDPAALLENTEAHITFRNIDPEQEWID